MTESNCNGQIADRQTARGAGGRLQRQLGIVQRRSDVASQLRNQKIADSRRHIPMATADTLQIDERAERSRPVQQQLVRHAGRLRLHVGPNVTVLDVRQFNDRVISAYENGTAEKGLPADLPVARSLVPAGTAALRDFSYVAPEIPEYIAGELHRLHGLRHTLPRYGHSGQSDRRKRLAEPRSTRSRIEADREHVPAPVVAAAQVL